MTFSELLDDLQKLLRELADTEELAERATAERILFRLRDLRLAVVPKTPSQRACDVGAAALGTGNRDDRLKTADAMYRDMLKTDDLALQLPRTDGRLS